VTRPLLALPVCRHTPGAAGGGPLPAAAGRRHVIHAPPGGLQRPRPGAPAGSVAPGLQPGGPPVVADVPGVHGRSGPVPPRGAPWWGPGGDGVPSRVGRGTARRPPEPAPPAQAAASPGAVGGAGRVQPWREPHPFHRGASAWQSIATGQRQGQVRGHGHRALRLAPRRQRSRGPLRVVQPLAPQGSLRESAHDLTTMFGTAPNLRDLCVIKLKLEEFKAKGC
jgi:hypothetical protein